MPYTVSGVADRYYYGTGADRRRRARLDGRRPQHRAGRDGRRAAHVRGLSRIPGRVEYIHPLHNLAVVSYDPALIGATPVKSATFAPQELLPGHDVPSSAGSRLQADVAVGARSRRSPRRTSRCRAPCASATRISRPFRSSMVPMTSTARSSTRRVACLACGRASLTRPGGISRSSTWASRPISWST